MHKIVSLSLDERIVAWLDDEIIREPDCHNRSQLIRKIIQNYVDVFKNIGHCVYDYKDPDAFYKVAKYIGFDRFDK